MEFRYFSTTAPPGSCAPLHAFERAAHANDFRYVTWSRPGYSGSTRHAGRAIVDVVPDAVAVMNHINAERCVVAGWSGGGPHALATAAGLPNQIDAVLSIASVAPYDAADLDYLADTGEQNVEETLAALEGEAKLRPPLEEQAADLHGSDARTIVDGLRSLLTPVDVRQLTDEFGADMAGQFNEALSRGVDGFVDDNLAFVEPWGFDLSKITAPTFIWQGDQDLMVPFGHGKWLAAHIPHSTAHLEYGEGHLSIAVGAAERMLEELRGALPYAPHEQTRN